MSTALAVCHGRFGRAALYSLDRPMATHAHREGHLIFHVDGPPATVLVCGRPQPLSPGRAVAVNPWEPHDFQPGRSDRLSSFLILYIRPDWFGEAARDLPRERGLRFGAASLDATGLSARTISDMATLLASFGPEGALAERLQLLTRECYDKSWRGVEEHGHGGAGRSLAGDFRIRKAMRLIAGRIGEPIVLDEVARESGLSRPHFYKLFRLQTGITPNLFLNTLRMEGAIRALAETKEPVTGIGLDLGFSSQSCFTRFFAANVGMAPSDYRRVARLVDA